MMRTKWIALGTAALLLPPAAAQAQQASPAYNWSGFYLGLNAGGAWGRAESNTSLDPVGTFSSASSAQIAAAGTGPSSDSAFTGGVQAGYNWQSGNYVYGLEADFGAFNVHASRAVTAISGGGPNTFTITNSADTDWLFTARGRFGALFSNVLVYFTGGLALTQLQVANFYSDNNVFAFTGSWGASKTKVGWTIGGGIELPIARNWTIKAEYLYLDFGSVSAAGTINDSFGQGYSHGISTSTDLTAHIARAGVNFKF
jgi:outer membrane immunogenic protein